MRWFKSKATAFFINLLRNFLIFLYGDNNINIDINCFMQYYYIELKNNNYIVR